MFAKNAITQVPINDSLARRWSGRAYDPARPVEHDKLLALLEAARWSPSCFGYEPWRFLVWDRMADPDNWQRALQCLAESNQTWVKSAPILLLACSDTQFADGRSNRWHQYDTGAAVMSLSVEATSQGLMVHQMGGFKADLIRSEFAIPETLECMTMITIGYQQAQDQISPELSERELAPRRRRELSELFFTGEWGRTIT